MCLDWIKVGNGDRDELYRIASHREKIWNKESFRWFNPLCGEGGDGRDYGQDRVWQIYTFAYYVRY